MTVEESIHVVFDENNQSEQGLAKINIEEDEQNIFLKSLENNTNSTGWFCETTDWKPAAGSTKGVEDPKRPIFW